jgi:hypothetical protein
MEFVQASAGAGRDTAGSGERREKGRLRLFAPTKSRALLFMFGYFPDLIFSLLPVPAGPSLLF